MRFKNELERNITIKLGYANAKIFRCKDLRCPRCGSGGYANAQRHSSTVLCAQPVRRDSQELREYLPFSMAAAPAGQLSQRR